MPSIPTTKWISAQLDSTHVPFRRRLKLIAVLDIINGTLLIILGVLELLYVALDKRLHLERLDYWQSFTTAVVHSILAFCINSIQILGARELLKGIDLNRQDPSCCIKSTQLWLRISAFLSITLVLKAIVFIFITFAIRDKILRIFWLANILAIVLEVTLRSIGCHYGREFLENLPIIRTTRITSYESHIVTIV